MGVCYKDNAPPPCRARCGFEPAIAGGELASRFCLTPASYYSPARNDIPDSFTVGSKLLGASQTQQLTQNHTSTKCPQSQMRRPP